MVVGERRKGGWVVGLFLVYGVIGGDEVEMGWIWEVRLL